MTQECTTTNPRESSTNPGRSRQSSYSHLRGKIPIAFSLVIAAAMAWCASAQLALAQAVPTERAEVAHPGGTIPGAPKLALVKVADGFHDPVGVTAANDGTGRLFVVERVGRVMIVGKDGKVLPDPFLEACHLPDGSGRIGPSLIGDTHHYPRFTTDKGIFEIVYGGATGAMQPFGKRLTQDQILKVIAYVRSLKKTN